jgi:hypothetical protein
LEESAMTHTRGGIYELVVQEPLDPSWSEWFDGFAITVAENRGTRIVGLVTDQTVLHGLLAKIRNLNLTVISVARAEGSGESWQEEGPDE